MRIENTVPATAACGVKCFIAKDTDNAKFCIATSICIARREETLTFTKIKIKYADNYNKSIEYIQQKLSQQNCESL